MNDFVKFWSFKRLKNKHVIGCIVLIVLVVAPVVCALVLSESMIRAMSDKYIYLSSGHLSVSHTDELSFDSYSEVEYSDSICTGYVMMYSQNESSTLYIKGIQDDYFNNDRLKHISFISEDTNSSGNLNEIIISEFTADHLGLSVGDRVAMMVVPDTAGKTMRPVIVRVGKIYTTGYEAIDSNLAFINYNYAKTLFESSDSLSTELILYDDNMIDSFKDKIVENYPVTSWMSSNYAVFSNFVTSKQVIFIILIVVITMAAFYTASAARLTNEDCMTDIAILKMVGCTNKHIFISSLITLLIATLLGSVLGLLLGLLISFNFSPLLKWLAKNGFDALRFYLIDFDPVISWPSILICLFTLLLISVISVSIVLRRTRTITPLQLFTDN